VVPSRLLYSRRPSCVLCVPSHLIFDLPSPLLSSPPRHPNFPPRRPVLGLVSLYWQCRIVPTTPACSSRPPSDALFSFLVCFCSMSSNRHRDREEEYVRLPGLRGPGVRLPHFRYSAADERKAVTILTLLILVRACACGWPRGSQPAGGGDFRFVSSPRRKNQSLTPLTLSFDRCTRHPLAHRRYWHREGKHSPFRTLHDSDGICNYARCDAPRHCPLVASAR